MRPLSVVDVMPILRAVEQTDAVLIGGQALQIWCDVFGKSSDALQREAPFTSKDVDFQGGPRVVAMCERSLGVLALRPTSMEDATNVGFLEAKLGAFSVGINVLTSPYGLTQKETAEFAVPVVVDDVTIRVLHPVMCMESRIANVGGLGRHSEKDLRQARASILCAQLFIQRLIDGGEERAARGLYERVFRFALRNQHARRAFRVHQLDAFSVVGADDKLPAKFNEVRLPQMRALLLRSRVA